MAKISFSDITNANTLSVINDNFDKIEQELTDRVAYRDNPTGLSNTFKQDVDLDGNNLYNVGMINAKGLLIDGESLEDFLLANGLTGILSYNRGVPGSVSRSYLDGFTKEVDVREFGAVADATTYNSGTNNTPMIQAAIDYANSIGAKVKIPAGRYRIGAPGLIISNVIGQSLEAFRTSLEGEGARGTILLGDSGNFNMISLRGVGNNAGSYSQQYVEKMAVLKSDVQGTCVYLDNHYHMSMTNVRTNGGNYGIYMLDVHESSFNNVVGTFANYGVFANRGTFTMPNILSFYNCSFGNCRNYALDIHNPATFVYVGGSIEGSQPIPGASPDPDPVRWACRLIWDDAVGEGTAGATFIGTYFEQNDGVADLWVSNNLVNTTINLIGCSFQRHVVHTENCIRFETSGTAKYNLNLIGNGFRGYTEYGYVTDVNRKYVNIVNPLGNVKVVDLGNNYYHEIERPNLDKYSGTISQKAVASCYVNTGDTSGTIEDSLNVASVQRLSAGVYQVNYAHPMTKARNAYSVTPIGFSKTYYNITAETVNSVTVTFKDFTDVDTDARFSLVVFGGADYAG